MLPKSQITRRATNNYSDARLKKGGMTRAFNDGYVIRKEGIYETF